MQTIKRGSPTRVPFTAVSSANLQTRLDASALAFTVRVAKADGTTAAGAGSGGIGGSGITQPDASNMLGCCYYLPGAGDVDTYGATIIRISAAGMEPRELTLQVVAFDPSDPIRAGLTALRPDAMPGGAVTAGTSLAYAFSTDLTIASGALAGEAHCRFVTGALAGQVQRINGYSGGVLSFYAGFSAAPAIGDTFVIVNG